VNRTSFRQVRRRVLEADEKLGYPLNNAARMLASGRTRSIGVVTSGPPDTVSPPLLVASSEPFGTPATPCVWSSTLEGDERSIAGAVDSLLEQGVDGIVISEPVDEGEVASVRRAGPLPRCAPVFTASRP